MVSTNLFMVYCALALLLLGCKASTDLPARQGLSYDPPGSTDTHSKPVVLQKQQVYHYGEIYFSNQFEGARLNSLEQVNDTSFLALISPENAPINMSPWYAFKTWSTSAKNVQLVLSYEEGRHRYYPKLSDNGKDWRPMPTENYQVDTASQTATLKLALSKDTLWVAAQELLTSDYAYAWVAKMAHLPDVTQVEIGRSTLGKPIMALEMGKIPSKKLLLVISRQHPPEVTGYLGMEAFVETLASQAPLAQQFRKKFGVLVVPMVNPDGVDNGHWRHNMGGVDLNRDWAYFRQPETHSVSQYFLKRVKEQKAKVPFALDFHSTWYDIFYTLDSTVVNPQKSLTKAWLEGITERLPEMEMKESASGLGSPVSKNWFYQAFKAEGVTYEIGDSTDRTALKEKGRVAAEVLMELLLKGK